MLPKMFCSSNLLNINTYLSYFKLFAFSFYVPKTQLKLETPLSKLIRSVSAARTGGRAGEILLDLLS